ncbi:type II secretion system protein F (GspF) [Clostridium sp. USBA 49]|uniref:type II secretion system F family protein n=1 Tax=Clostridium sp. USBA 49 TaxID=1881060 RepID=UPI00099AE050|nr:type II secretion system F family protein [Clostridium sp. USBA 49]SKA80386.1 type II secretion system protein F (GspF) [Clostridium sp. USBA 49]
MPLYKYKAVNEKGEKIEGTYNGTSKDDVISMISTNNYYPLKIEEINERGKINFEIFNRVTIKDIAVFCRQFYTMLDAGLSINNALHILSEQLTNKKFKETISNIEEEVRKGSTLSEAMKLHNNIFPDLLINMIETGELSGNLDQIMLRMSNHYEKENKINNKVKNAMIYPIILSIISITVISVILIFVMPVFVDMFTNSGVELPLTTKILLGISNGIRENIIIIFLLISIIITLVRYYLKTDNGLLWINKMKLSLPIIKELNQKIIVSRFTRTLSTMLSSGLPLIQSLQIVGQVIGNKLVEDALNTVREKVIKGEGLALPIKETGLFPPMLSSMIGIGEESGALDEILNKTADFYDEELDTAITTFTSMLEPIMIVVMGVIVGFLIISIIQPMFGMYSTIQ